jgi:hypothetical protein
MKPTNQRTSGSGKQRKKSTRKEARRSSQSPEIVHKDIEAAQTTASDSPFVILRIHIDHLEVVTHPTSGVTVGRDSINLESTSYLPVLKGSLERFNFLRSDASWLEVVAHNLFDPIQQRGSLWTHRDGTSTEWQNQFRDEMSWRRIYPNEALQEHIYEYVLPESALVSLPRIAYLRTGSSATSIAEKDHSTQFRAAVRERDGSCVITHLPERESEYSATKYRITSTHIASHIVPKRLRDKIRLISERHVNIPGANVSNTFDRRNGLFLTTVMDTPFDRFEVGLFRDPVS